MRESTASGWHVREFGSETGPTVLYLHGLGESGLCFEGVLDLPVLGEWRHVVPDLPGYGRTPWPDAAPGLEQTADAVAAWLPSVASVPAAVAGHSMGGVLAQLLAERHPALVTMLLDIDGNKSLPDCTFSSRAAALSLSAFENGGFDALRETIRAAGAEDRAQSGYYASLCMTDPKVFHRHATELLAMSRREDLAQRLAALPVPVLYIAGSPGGACRRTLELLRQACIPCCSISPSGHWPFIDRPAEFAACLRGALRAFRRDDDRS